VQEDSCAYHEKSVKLKSHTEHIF